MLFTPGEFAPVAQDVYNSKVSGLKVVHFGSATGCACAAERTQVLTSHAAQSEPRAGLESCEDCAGGTAFRTEWQTFCFSE